MGYLSLDRKTVYGNTVNIKQMAENNQEKNTATPYVAGWWKRITDALRTDRTGEIAKLLHISPSSISDWKHGRTYPSLERLREIAFYGETTIEWLMRGDGDKDTQGDETYFDEWFLPTAYRDLIRDLAKERGVPKGSVAKDLLIEAMQNHLSDKKARRAIIHLDENALKELIREVVRDELNEPLAHQHPVISDETEDTKKSRKGKAK